VSVCLAGRVHFLIQCIWQTQKTESVRIWLSLRADVLGRGLQTVQHKSETCVVIAYSTELVKRYRS